MRGVSTNKDGDKGGMETEEVRNPPPGMLRGLRSSEDLDLGEELILNASDRISFQGSLLTLTNRLCSLLLQLFLEIGEHLEKLTFSGASRFKLINQHLRHDSWEESSSPTSLM